MQNYFPNTQKPKSGSEQVIDSLKQIQQNIDNETRPNMKLILVNLMKQLCTLSKDNGIILPVEFYKYVPTPTFGS